MPKTFKIVPEWRNFAKSGRSASDSSSLVRKSLTIGGMAPTIEAKFEVLDYIVFVRFFVIDGCTRIKLLEFLARTLNPQAVSHTVLCKIKTTIFFVPSSVTRKNRQMSIKVAQK